MAKQFLSPSAIQTLRETVRKVRAMGGPGLPEKLNRQPNAENDDWPGIVVAAEDLDLDEPTDHQYYVCRADLQISDLATDPVQIAGPAVEGDIAYLVGTQTGAFTRGDAVTQGASEGTVISATTDETPHTRDVLGVQVTAGTFATGTVSRTGGGSADIHRIVTPGPTVVLATNFAEQFTATHALEAGQFIDEVHVRTRADGTRRAFFCLQPLLATMLIGGGFNAVGTQAANGIASFDGSRVTAYQSDPVDVSMFFADAAWYKGELYGCGLFTLADTTLRYFIKWDSANGRWIDVGGNLLEAGWRLLVDADYIYLAGQAKVANTNAVWRYDGTDFVALAHPTGYNGVIIRDLIKWGGFTDSDVLISAGETLGEGKMPISYWTGTEWAEIDGEITGGIGVIYSMEAHDDGRGDGEQLYIAGNFTDADGVTVVNVARYSGTQWSAVGGGITGSGSALSLKSLPGVAGEPDMLYAGGAEAGGDPLSVWDGSSWQDAGMPLIRCVDEPWIYGMDVMTRGSQSRLVAGGRFHSRATSEGYGDMRRIAIWDTVTAAYIPVAGGFNRTVRALATYGGRLYAGGDFTVASGITHTNRIASADLSGASSGWQWEPVGGGLLASVRGLCTCDLGAGLSLYAVGSLGYLAKWNGAAWFDDFTIVGTAYGIIRNRAGTLLIVFGDFSKAGGAARPCLVSWDGSTNTALAANIYRASGGAAVIYCAAYDDYGNLYVGGQFDAFGETSCHNVAKLVDGTWESLTDDGEEGVEGAVFSLCWDSTNERMYIGGDFQTIRGGATAAPFLVYWEPSSSQFTKCEGSGPSGTTWERPIRSMVEANLGDGSKRYVGSMGKVGGGMGADLYGVWGASDATWGILGESAGTVDGDVRAMLYQASSGGDEQLVIAGDFRSAGTDSGTPDQPCMLVAAYNANGWIDLAGGVANDPTRFDPTPIEPGFVQRVRVQTPPGGARPVVLCVGDFPQASARYARGAARLTRFGILPFRGSFSGENGTLQPGVWEWCRRVNGAVVAGGNFSHAYNRWMNDAAPDGAELMPETVGIAEWREGYWWPMGSGLGGLVQAIAEYEETIVAASWVDLPYVYNELAKTWSLLDAAFAPDSVSIIRLVTVPTATPRLWLIGAWQKGAASDTAGYVDSLEGTITNDSPPAGLAELRDALVHDSVLHVCGTSNSGTRCVYRYSGGSWSAVGSGNLSGQALGLASLTVAATDTSPAKVYLFCVGALSLGALECTVAMLYDGEWSRIATSPGGGVVSVAFGIDTQGVVVVGGEFQEIQGIESEIVQAPFLAQYDPVTNIWRNLPGGSINGIPMRLG
jgi:hypothetical protein